MTRPQWVPVAVIGACLATSSAIFACGTDETGAPAPTATAAPLSVPSDLSAYLVDNNDLKRYRAGTPERTFLLWWQALQYDNTTDAHALLSRALKASRPRERFQSDARIAAGGFSAKPQIKQVRTEQAGRVMLLVNVLILGKGGTVAALVPRTFRLVQESGEWRIADLSFFDVKTTEGRKAQRAARRRAASGAG